MTEGWPSASGNGDLGEHDLDDDFDEEWLAEWDEADRQAVEALRGALPDRPGEAAPAAALAQAAARVRAEFGDAGSPLGWVRQAAGLAREAPGDDDAELLIRCAAATISPVEETGLEPEEEAYLLSLEHADWLGAVLSAVRAGPGADASPESLVSGIATCPEVDFGSELDDDERSHIEAAFWSLALPWQILGITDPDQRLTGLGAWLLPRALARAWNGDFDQGPDAGRT